MAYLAPRSHSVGGIGMSAGSPLNRVSKKGAFAGYNTVIKTVNNRRTPVYAATPAADVTGHFHMSFL